MRKQWWLAQKRYGSRFRRQLHYFLKQYSRVFILGHVMSRDDISLTKHGLKIPADAADYAGFVLRMSICEQECKRELTG